MTHPYLIRVSPPDGDCAPDRVIAQRTGLELVWQGRGAAVFAGAGCPTLALGESGMVLGSLFPRHGPGRRLGLLDAEESAAILADPALRLLDAYWGSYVAVVDGPDGPWIGRDPSGAMPCYSVGGSGARWFGSDTALLLAAAGRAPVIDPAALSRHLFANGLPRAETALQGVGELLPGFQAGSGGGAAERSPEPGQDGVQRIWWSPWEHRGNERDPDPQALAETLGRSVRGCVGALTHGHARLLVSVSGGIDSSIVAACLAEAGRDAIALTLYTDDPRGDERAFARMLCETLRLELFEHRYVTDEADIAATLSAHLPRPMGRTPAQVYEGAHLALARAQGVDAFVTGNGGDNVFAYSQSAAALADRWRVEGAGSGVLATLRDICRQTGCTPVRALRAAIALRTRGGFRWQGDATLLDRGVAADLAAAPLSHPWLAAPPDALPGQLAHVAGLLRVQPTLEPMRARVAPVISPLTAQPVIETCLKVPSWLWRTGGRDRALARAAFAGALPAAILARKAKGGPGGFGTELIEAHRARIRERLLGGRLAGWGLLDRPALERILGDWRPTLGDEQGRVHDLLEAEAWADHWAGLAASPD